MCCDEKLPIIVSPWQQTKQRLTGDANELLTLRKQKQSRPRRKYSPAQKHHRPPIKHVAALLPLDCSGSVCVCVCDSNRCHLHFCAWVIPLIERPESWHLSASLQKWSDQESCEPAGRRLSDRLFVRPPARRVRLVLGRLTCWCTCQISINTFPWSINLLQNTTVPAFLACAYLTVMSLTRGLLFSSSLQVSLLTLMEESIKRKGTQVWLLVWLCSCGCSFFSGGSGGSVLWPHFFCRV